MDTFIALFYDVIFIIKYHLQRNKFFFTKNARLKKTLTPIKL